MPAGFPPDVDAEAEAAARAARAGTPRVDLPFVTLDPPGARDLDQALHIERRGDGHRVRYAIADVGALVARGGALDRDTHARGVTVYAPDAKAPLGARRRAARRPRAGGRAGRKRLYRALPRAACERGMGRAGLAADRDGGRGADAARRQRHPSHPGRRPTSARSSGCAGRRTPSGSTGRAPGPTRSSCVASTPRCPCTPRWRTRRRAWAGARATPRSTAPRPRSPSTSRSPPPTRTPPRRCGACRTATSRSAAWPRAPALS